MSGFKFKYFTVQQSDSAMKVGTDAMLLGAFVETVGKQFALDIGTGTGVIALMMAQKNEAILIDAVEIDQKSANEAQLNFQNSSWSDRLKIHHSDFLTFPPEKQYDLIVSNPPYFSTTNENQNERKAQARHVSSLAIAPFIEKANALLSPDGSFWIIIPYNDFDLWYSHIEANSLRISQRINVIGKDGNEPIRCILKMGFSTIETRTKVFSIRNSDNAYSNEYVELTKEFHGVEL